MELSVTGINATWLHANLTSTEKVVRTGHNVHIKMHIFTLLQASVVDCVSVVDCEGNLHFMGSIVRRLLGVGGKEPIVLNRGSTVPLTQTTIDISSQINDIDEHIAVN